MGPVGVGSGPYARPVQRPGVTSSPGRVNEHEIAHLGRMMMHTAGGLGGEESTTSLRVATPGDRRPKSSPLDGFIVMVGVRGFEPRAPASRRRCSTRLSYTPQPSGAA